MKKLLAVLALCVMLLPIGAMAFDTEPGKFKEFWRWDWDPIQRSHQDPVLYVDVSTTCTKLTIIGTAEGSIPDYTADEGYHRHKATGIYAQEGSAFHIGNGYFVTNQHVIATSYVSIQISKNVTWIVPAERVLTQMVTIGQSTIIGSWPAEIIWSDETLDLALVKITGPCPALEDWGYRPYPTYDSGQDLLDVGDAIAVVVAIRQDPTIGNLEKTPWFEVRYGKIVSTRPIPPKGVDSSILPWFSLNDVTMDIQIYPGDSGSPVFAFKNGRPVIIGVARAFAAYYDWVSGEIYWYSYFTRIDKVWHYSRIK